jgi:hypothetical protein
MKFCLHLLFFLFFISLEINAQAQFERGFIITNEGDTLRGYVQYLDWEISPETILFRMERTSEDKQFSAGEIVGFSIDSVNECYVSKNIGVINLNSSQVFSMPPSLIPSHHKNVFLQTIIKGPEASLYKYVNDVGEEHFYIETPILFQELTNYSYYQYQDGRQYRARREDYKMQLASICINSDSFDGRIPNYNEKELIKYLEKYNSCFLGETIVYRSPVSPVVFDAMIGFGYDKFFDRFSYCLGVRASFPKQFHSRFFRAAISLVPGVPQEQKNGQKMRSRFSAGFGKYFGSGAIHPYFVMSCDFFKKEGSGAPFILTASVGVNYRRQFELEVGHWNNFAASMMKQSFFLPPSISLHYYPNFWKKKK